MFKYNNNNQTQLDRFGNPYMIKSVSIKEKKNGYEEARCFVEIGGKTYKIEVSPAKKDGVEYWLKITKQTPRKTGTF